MSSQFLGFAGLFVILGVALFMMWPRGSSGAGSFHNGSDWGGGGGGGFDTSDHGHGGSDSGGDGGGSSH